MTLKKLTSAAKKYGTDKLQHGYLPFYASLLTKDTRSILEIGTYEGASACMWSALLPKGEDAGRLVSVDITDEHYLRGNLVGIFAELQAKCNNAELVWEDINEWLPADGERFDLIIDDGSHRNTDQIAAFNALWPFLAPGGWYVIEDLHTSEPYVYASHAPEQWNRPGQPTIMAWLCDQWNELNQWGMTEYGLRSEATYAELRAARSIAALRKPYEES